ncbi:MAG TPA: hypothetical protein VFM31_05900 [Nitrososphaeraceae archaeon]|nr:hypothetical protein [Nitrososphaeraceae archaeon]
MINKFNINNNPNPPAVIKNAVILPLWIGITFVGIMTTFLILSPDIFTKVSGSIAPSNEDGTNTTLSKITETGVYDPEAVLAKMEAAFGKPFYELADSKDTGKEVVSIHPQQTKDSYIATGNMSGIGNVTEYGTYISTYSSPSISSTGKGMIVQNDNVVTFTAEDTGKYDRFGNLLLKGSMFFESDSDEMKSIDGKVGLYLYWKDANGTDWTKTWLWE